MCTAIRFTDTRRNVYFGRNLDWNRMYGGRVVVVPKGHEQARAFGEASKAAHAVVGMASVAKGTPLFFDCANDAGLCVAGLSFTGYTRYEAAPASGKDNVAAFELPYWAASRFSSVDQAEEALADVAVVDRPAAPGLATSMLHWMIADKDRSIVVEYDERGMHVFHDGVDVLANQPTFDWHMENLRNYLTCTGEKASSAKWGTVVLHPYGSGAGMRGIPGDVYSPSRFVRAAFVNTSCPRRDGERANVVRAFHTLGSVSMVDGCAQMADGTYERTLYSCCYSARTRRYYVKGYDDLAVKAVCLDDYADADPSKVVEPTPQDAEGLLADEPAASDAERHAATKPSAAV